MPVMLQLSGISVAQINFLNSCFHISLCIDIDRETKGCVALPWFVYTAIFNTVVNKRKMTLMVC